MKPRAPAHLAYVVVEPLPESDDAGPRVFLRRVPGGPTVVLADTAAQIWLAAAWGEPDIAATLAEHYSQPAEAVRDEVDSFIASLVAQGFLEPIE